MSSPAAKPLQSINAFTREDGTPLNYTWSTPKTGKTDFEVNQLRINTDNSHHRYDAHPHQRRAVCRSN